VESRTLTSRLVNVGEVKPPPTFCCWPTRRAVARIRAQGSRTKARVSKAMGARHKGARGKACLPSHDRYG